MATSSLSERAFADALLVRGSRIETAYDVDGERVWWACTLLAEHENENYQERPVFAVEFDPIPEKRFPDPTRAKIAFLDETTCVDVDSREQCTWRFCAGSLRVDVPSKTKKEKPTREEATRNATAAVDEILAGLIAAHGRTAEALPFDVQTHVFDRLTVMREKLIESLTEELLKTGEVNEESAQRIVDMIRDSMESS